MNFKIIDNNHSSLIHKLAFYFYFCITFATLFILLLALHFVNLNFPLFERIKFYLSCIIFALIVTVVVTTVLFLISVAKDMHNIYCIKNNKNVIQSNDAVSDFNKKNEKDDEDARNTEIPINEDLSKDTEFIEKVSKINVMSQHDDVPSYHKILQIKQHNTPIVL